MTDTSRAAANVTVVDNPEARRFEARRNGELAGFVDYRVSADGVALPHTKTLPAFLRQGVATALIKATLDTLRERGQSVLPFCPFVSDYIRANPAYLDLVPIGHRAQFGL
jgi:predicted GNAT family acetyltransferase